VDKAYNHKDVEEKIYREWEQKGYFKPEINPKGKPYCIILPPPNANGALHFGHAMYVIEDILIRYHRMRGNSTLWLPGADHAGFETQYVFEKKLQKEGKSRFDFDRETLYRMIWDYVQNNRSGMEGQLRRLGFSLDWTRNKFTLDKDIVKIVYQTFKKMYDEGLVYRGDRLVNYCTRCGTSFSDLEVNHKEQKDPLYYIKYGPFVLATVRPETKFGDTAVAVNPKDKRYKSWIGKEIEVQGVIGKFRVRVIADEMIDPNFGTGVAKVTPAHDMKDFEIALRHNLKRVQVIGLDGKLNEKTGKYKGLYIKQARKLIAQDLRKMGLIEKIDENYTHTIEVCYKCGITIEPMLLPQWFIKTEVLARSAIEAVRKGKIKIFPKRLEKIYFQFLENIRDWNISRQIVWGIRIPAWKCSRCHPDRVRQRRRVEGSLLTAVASGDSSTPLRSAQNDKRDGWIVTEGERPEECLSCGSADLEQDVDTFDTWFSSAQWPFATLLTQSGISNFQFLISNKDDSKFEDYAYFYPTSVMETGYDILRWWVARMVMVGLYVTKKIPFEHIVLHGLVNDPLGKKMSKSKGNVVDPLELVDKYGADAVRFALVCGTALGNDQSLSYPKLEAARKFTNKLWNMARFIYINRTQNSKLKTQNFHPLPFPLSPRRERAGVRGNNLTIKQLSNIARHKNDKEMIKKTQELVKEVTQDLDNYNFNFAAERLYDFAWHEFADKYIEDVKNRINENSFLVLSSLFLVQMKLLHPFMPFVTEEIYQRFNPPSGGGESIMIDRWPVS